MTADFKALIDLVASGKVDITELVSAVYPADQAADAFDALTHNDGSLTKVLLRFADPE